MRRTLQRPSLRAAGEADEPFIARLSHEAFGRFAAHPDRSVRRMIRQAARTVVATLGGERVGFAVLRLQRHRSLGPLERPVTGHVDAIAVRPACRERGIGRTLLDDVEGTAEDAGALSMFLMTAVENGPARRLFESAGYECLAAGPAIYADRHAALMMMKLLP